MQYRGISINSDRGRYITKGLKQTWRHDLIIAIRQRSEEEYHSVIKYLIDYILDCKTVIKPNQTIAYYSWLLKFRLVLCQDLEQIKMRNSSA